jgi:hypothetical protein
MVAVASAAQPGAYAQDATTPHTSPEPSATPAAGNGKLTILQPSERASALVDQLRGRPLGRQNVDAAIAILVGSGIGTYEAGATIPIEPVRAPESPLRHLSDQVRNMGLEAWAGAGTLGAETDALAGLVDGLVPASHLVAGMSPPSTRQEPMLLGPSWETRTSRELPSWCFPSSC